MFIRNLLCALMVTLLACSSLQAIQNLNGESGYVLQPDAGIVPAKELEVSAGYVASEGSNELGQLEFESMPCHGRGENIRGTYGIGNRAEIGIDWFDIHKSIGQSSAVSLAGKIKIMEKPESGIALSIGGLIRNWSTEISQPIAGGGVMKLDIPIVSYAYLVLDKTWKPANSSVPTISGSIGLMFTRYGRSIQQPAPFQPSPGVPISTNGRVANEKFIEPFIGAKARCPCEWTILGDYMPPLRKGSFYYQSTAWSLAVRKELSSRLVGTAGLTTFNLPYTDANPGWFVDLSYIFK